MAACNSTLDKPRWDVYPGLMTKNTDPAGLSSSLERVSTFLLAHYAADTDEGRDGGRDFAWVDYDGKTVALNADDLYAVLNAAMTPSLPTREQIAPLAGFLADLETGESSYYGADDWREVQRDLGALLALLQKGTDRG